jgi:mRNA interferase RelE/StbE
MKTDFAQSFARDLRRLPDTSIRRRVQQAIERIEEASRLTEVPNVEKIQGQSDFYRLRVGDYRLGFRLDEQAVVFLRCLHRREVYEKFP